MHIVADENPGALGEANETRCVRENNMTVDEMPVIVPIAPIKVLIIDDELFGLTFSHLQESANDFAEELSDSNNPLIETLWPWVEKLAGQPKFDGLSVEAIDAFLKSDAFVKEVLLDDAFRKSEDASPLLSQFYYRVEHVQTLRGILDKAFEAPTFATKYEAARPSAPSLLLSYDLIVFDLVLHGSASAVDELSTYLEALSKAVGEEALPRIIIMSSHQEMVEHRLKFSSASSISAAGMLLLEKAQVTKPQFGVQGLILSYQQLERQRDIAQHMRSFMRLWSNALAGAQKAATQTLWNLDASALQAIHLTAMIDDDPYDQHLSELVAREYLWHVEGAPGVTNAIAALDEGFQKRFTAENKSAFIRERLITPFVDAKPGRDIVSHYTWTGFPLETITGLATEALRGKFNRLFPFGAVLAPEALVAGSECWVHITQQCDLNGAVRAPAAGSSVSGKSAMFAAAIAQPVNDQMVPEHATEDLVARGLRIDGNEFDLKYQRGLIMSLPIPALVEHIAKEKLRVVGRLRHDIASHFLSAATNHMTRPASMKSTRMEVRPTRLYLLGDKFAAGFQAFIGAGGDEVRMVNMAVSGKKHSFQDDACMWLAIWIEQQLTSLYSRTNLDISVVCDLLSAGLTINQNIVSIASFDALKAPFDQAEAMAKRKKPQDGKVTLLAIYEA